jgi:hypothetical protein
VDEILRGTVILKHGKETHAVFQVHETVQVEIDWKVWLEVTPRGLTNVSQRQLVAAIFRSENVFLFFEVKKEHWL